MIKKIISIILVLAMFTSPVFASGRDDETELIPFDTEESGFIEDSFPDKLGITPEKYEELKYRLLNTSHSFGNSCYIGDLDIHSKSDIFEILFFILRDNDPLGFHIQTLSVDFNHSDDSPQNVDFTYKGTKTEYFEKTAAIREAADAMLADIITNDALSDIQKIVILHDRLAVHARYDVQNHKLGINAIPADDYTPYGAFVNRKCVCDGFSSAYKYLLDNAGIRNYYVTSRELNHSWNIVETGGKLYHVDTTWDASGTYICSGWISHRYLLKSTENFGHDASDYDNSPRDTEYDNAFWKDSNTAFCVLDGVVYYIDNVQKTLNVWGEDERYPVYTITERWEVPGSRRTTSSGMTSVAYYSSNFSNLTNDDLYLYYSTSDTIWRFDTKSMTRSVAAKLDLPYEEGRSIFGLTAENDTFICTVYNRNNFSAYDIDDYIIEIPYNIPILKGDVDGDGEVTSKDSRAIKSFIVDKIGSQSFIFYTADVDNDDDISSKDSRLIKKMVVS